MPQEESPEFRQRSHQQLDNALSLMDMPQASAYRTALQVAPHLFVDETHPLKWLRTADFDPWAAARNICLYWKYRREYFGERWLFPLSQQSSTGALFPLDVELLRAGYAIDYGEHVYVDYLRLTDFAGSTEHQKYTDEDLELARVRILFYGMTVTSTTRNQRHGKTFLVMLEGVTQGRLWKQTMGKHIWPCKFAKIYLVQLETRFQHAVLRYWLQFFLHSIQTYFHVQSTPQLMFATTREEMLHKILAVGFPLTMIPAHLGGPTSRHQQVDEWMTWLATRDDQRIQRMLFAKEPSTSASVGMPSESTVSAPRQSPRQPKQGKKSKPSPFSIPFQSVDYRTLTIERRVNGADEVKSFAFDNEHLATDSPFSLNGAY